MVLVAVVAVLLASAAVGAVTVFSGSDDGSATGREADLYDGAYTIAESADFDSHSELVSACIEGMLDAYGEVTASEEDAVRRGCEDGAVASQEAASDVSAERQEMESALTLLNRDGTSSSMFSLLPRLGSTRCNVAYSADFPDLVLVSAVSSSGMWVQVTVHPVNGVEFASLKTGKDFVAAGFDESFWSTGYSCSIGSNGIVLTP